MKILHTSDWHLGQILYGYDRTDEFLHFFAQLKDIILSIRPDAMLVSGDIYDVSSPSTAVMRMFKDNLLEIHSLVPEMKIIVTAGNHDSASRIDVDRNLWRASGIDVIGSTKRVEGIYDFSDNIVEVPGKGYVAAIPFVNSAFIPKTEDDEPAIKTFFRNVLEETKKHNVSGLPMVLMAHVTVTDCDMTGHRSSPIGGIDAVGLDSFDGFDYVALGHIHKSLIMCGGRVAYCGTPLAISFDEDFEHSVSVVTIEKDKANEIERYPIFPYRELLTIPSVGKPFNEVMGLYKKIKPDDKCYVRLNVCQEEGLPIDCNEKATEIAKNKECRFCTFKYEPLKKDVDKDPLCGITASEFLETTPVDIAGRFLRSKGTSEDVLKHYLELISEIEVEIASEEAE